MKKLALIAVLIALLGTSVAYAMETNTYTGQTGKWDYWFSVPFTTYRDGDIVVTASWVPKPAGAYQLYVHTSSGVYGPNCISTTERGNGQSFTSCSIINAPVGNYFAEFRSVYGGKVVVTLTVTAETNP